MDIGESVTGSSKPKTDWDELCPSCMTSNRAGVDFCVQCGRPLSSYAAVGPLESIRTEGFLYRGAVSGRKSRLVLVGLWLICAAMLMGMTFSLLTGPKHGNGVGVALPMGFFFVLFGAMLWKATRNHTARNPDTRDHEEDDSTT